MRRLLAAGLVGVLGACVGSEPPVPVAVALPPPVARPAIEGPTLNPDGTCTGSAPMTATAIAPGISECELVRLKGKPPTDVLVGESGRGGREVQVLYSEPGGRELYFLVDGRLERIVK